MNLSARKMAQVCVLTSVTAIILSACSSSSPTAKAVVQTKTITIGWLAEETGPWASYGNESLKAAKLAVEEINASNPLFQIKLVVEDDQSTPEGGLAAVQRLLRDSGVNLLAGVTPTQIGQAIEPLLATQKLPTVFVGVANIQPRSDNIMSMLRPNGPLQDALVTDYLQPKGLKRLAVIWQEQPTLHGNRDHLVNAAKNAGIDVVADRGTALTTTDFKPQIDAVLAAKPDVISLNVLTQAAGTISVELRKRGFKGTIVSHAGVASPLLTQVGGTAVEGIVLPTFWYPKVENPISQKFVADFKSKYPTDPAPQNYGMAGYDLIHVVEDAATSAKSTDAVNLTKSLRDGTYDIGLKQGFKFDADGYGELDSHLVRWENGEPTPIK